MKISSSSQSRIEQSLCTVLKAYAVESESFVTDILLQPLFETGELVIYNDSDEELTRVSVPEWAEQPTTDVEFYSEMETWLGGLLKDLQNKGMMDKLAILKPYSFVMVDAEKETLAELLLMDDETLLLDNELLKGLDKELDDFLKQLLDMST